MAFQFISNTVIFLLTYIKYLIISNYQSLNYKAVFCLQVVIYKRLQIWRHNYVIRSNEYI